MSNCAITSKSKTSYTCLTKDDLLKISKKMDLTIGKNTNKRTVFNLLKSNLGNDEKKWHAQTCSHFDGIISHLYTGQWPVLL